VNVLPQLNIVDATATYRLKFKVPWARWTDAELEKDYYIWSRTGNGSMIIEAVDVDGNTISPISIRARASISMNGSNISWQDLEEGLHVIRLEVGDGKGIGNRRIYLFVGEYDDFENINSVVNNNRVGQDQSYLVRTSSAEYVTSVADIFCEKETDWPHYHKVEGVDSSLYSNRLTIWPLNEEVSIRGNTDSLLSSNAILSFVKNHHRSVRSYVKLRLKQDEDCYYEFYDHVGIPRHFEIRRISKIVDGNEVKVVSRLAAHNWESPIIFEKKDKVIKITGWGDSIEMQDSQPLDIRDWEILFVYLDVGNDGVSEKYAYATIDNVYFVKGEDIVTSLHEQEQR